MGCDVGINCDYHSRLHWWIPNDLAVVLLLFLHKVESLTLLQDKIGHGVVLGWGGQVKVLEPVSLQQKLVAAAQKIIQNYEASY